MKQLCADVIGQLCVAASGVLCLIATAIMLMAGGFWSLGERLLLWADEQAMGAKQHNVWNGV